MACIISSYHLCISNAKFNVCVCSCVCMYMCRSTLTYVEARVTSDVFLGPCPPYGLRQGLSLTLELTELAWVASWKVGLRDLPVSASPAPERQAEPHACGFLKHGFWRSKLAPVFAQPMMTTGEALAPSLNF